MWAYVQDIWCRLNVWRKFDFNLAFGDTRKSLKGPWRSPYAVVDAISEYITGKSVCEIGSACGDISIYMRDRYQCRVVGIELSENRVRALRKKGLEVVHGDALECKLPSCDVYYFWMGDYEMQTQLIDRISNGLIIVLNEKESERPDAWIDSGVEKKNIELLREKYNCRQIDVPFDEGSGIRQKGVFTVSIIDKQ